METVYKHLNITEEVCGEGKVNKYIGNPQGVYRVSHNHNVSGEYSSNSERYAERSICPVLGQQDSPYFIEISSTKVRNDFKASMVLCADHEVPNMFMFIVRVVEVSD